MIHISIMVPTRGRVFSLVRLLNSIADTTQCLPNVEVILYMDEDDVESHSIRHEKINIIRLIRPRGATMGAIYSTCLEASSGSYLMLMNDDAVFMTHGWDTLVMEAFSRFPDRLALVYGNDLDQGKNVPTFPIISREYAELIGGIVPISYKNLHLESHLLDIFKQLRILGHDRIIYLNDVVFEHMHFSLNKAELDETYVKKSPQDDNRLFMELDEERVATSKILAVHIENLQAWHGVVPELSIIIYGKSSDLSNENSDFFHASTKELPFEVIKCHKPLCNDGGLKELDKCAQRARADYLLFIQASVLPRKGFLKSLLNDARNTRATILGCTLIDPLNDRVTHAGIGFYMHGNILKYSNIFYGFTSKSPEVNKTRELQAIGGECMLIEKNAFIEAGGFGSFPQGFEAIGICLKVREAGGHVVYSPNAKAFYSSKEARLLTIPKLLAEKIKPDLMDIMKEERYTLLKCPVKPFSFMVERRE